MAGTPQASGACSYPRLPSVLPGIPAASRRVTERRWPASARRRPGSASVTEGSVERVCQARRPGDELSADHDGRSLFTPPALSYVTHLERAVHFTIVQSTRVLPGALRVNTCAVLTGNSAIWPDARGSSGW